MTSVLLFIIGIVTILIFHRAPLQEKLVFESRTNQGKDAQMVGNNYLVIGTLEKLDWQKGNQGSLSPSEIVARMSVFQDQWHFEVMPARWYPNSSR
jgi:hypothetical protein